MHEIFMQKAIDLAELGRAFVAPNPLVGAVLVKNGKIVAEGYHKVFGDVHAEVACLESYGLPLAGDEVLYVTLEPCAHHGKQPSCAEYLVSKGLKKVVVGLEDPNPLVNGKGLAILRHSGCEVVAKEVCKEEIETQLRGFFSRIKKMRPYIVMKVAVTSMGQLARLPKERVAITGRLSKELTRKLRSQADGILVGHNTAKIDNPELACCIGDNYEPLRLIWGQTEQIELPSHYKLFRSDRWRYYSAASVTKLLKQISCNDLLVEAGGFVSGAFLAADVIDELYVVVNEDSPSFTNGLLAFQGVDARLHLGREMIFNESFNCGGDRWYRFSSRRR